jgi:hypothetical protein
MNRQPLRPLDPDEIEAFDREGVVPLAGMFDADWVDLLASGLERNRATPSPRARIWDRDAQGRTMFWDSQAWQGIDEYQTFVHESPAANIAAQLLGASKINFFFDAVFVRSPGSQFSTPWHQDEPYWSVEGHNTCSIWTPLVPVAAENALSFVPGSHRGNQVLAQPNFGELNPDKVDHACQTDFSAVAEGLFPDIDADPEKWGVVSWGMQPDDCIVSIAGSCTVVQGNCHQKAVSACSPLSGSVTTCR